MVAPDRVTSNVLAEVIAIFYEIVHDVVPERQGLFTRQLRHRVAIDGRSVLAGSGAAGRVSGPGPAWAARLENPVARLAAPSKPCWRAFIWRLTSVCRYVGKRGE